MKVVTAPRAVLLAAPHFYLDAAEAWLAERGLGWEHDERDESEALVEFSGRICYDAFGPRQHRRETEAYLNNILASEHFSVIEHASWTFLIEGVSRSLTHELIRHRHLSFSQVSQRFVDEGIEPEVVVPPAIAALPAGSEERALFLAAAEYAFTTYARVAALAEERLKAGRPGLSPIARRKAAREAARAVLPNATETKLVVTGNARAWRHFLELRGSGYAEPEIRRLACLLARTLADAAPGLFGDVEVQRADDRSEVVVVRHRGA